jgi:hypothetical protein
LRHVTPIPIAPIFQVPNLVLTRRRSFIDHIMKIKISGVQDKSKLKYEACNEMISGEEM